MNKKSTIMAYAILISSFLILLIILTNLSFNHYRAITNYKIDSLITALKKDYPNLSDNEIISILNQDTPSNVFYDYGYQIDDAYIKEMNKAYQKSLFVYSITYCIFIILLIWIYRQSYKAQKKRIMNIESYLQDMNQKKYHLKIKTNVEDELSILQNELYKTTIMLKQTSEQSKIEQERLKTSLEDISHQLKTPITSMQILLDNIIDHPDMDKKTKQEFLRDMNKQLDWTSNLIVALLKLSKLDANTVQMLDQSLSLKALFKDILDSLSILLDIKNIQVNLYFEGKDEMNLDYEWNKEALTNIIKNAIEHSKENSKIEIKVMNNNLFLTISIKDYGEGMNKEDKKRIFERFYKSKHSSQDSIGIGLSLSKSIIEKENGYITVDSVEGKGSIFTIKYLK